MLPRAVRSNPWIQAVLVVLLVACTFWFMYWIRDILLPFILAFIVAYIFDPAVDWLDENLPLGRMTAIGALVLVVGFLMLVFGAFLVDQVIELAEVIAKVAQNPPDLLGRIREWIPRRWENEVTYYLQDLRPQQLFERGLGFLRSHFTALVNALGQGTTILWLFATRTFGVVGFLVNVTVFLVVTLYLLRDFDLFIATIREQIPPSRRDEVDEVFREIDDLLRAFFRGHMIVCITIGILYGLGYMLVGLNGGFMVGLISGLMNVLPYLGPTLGFLVAFMMGLYQFGVSTWVITIPVVFVIVQSFEGNFLTPKVVGGAVGLNPVLVIFALMLFGKIMGFLGLLVAIPLTAIVKVLALRVLNWYRESEYFASSA